MPRKPRTHYTRPQLLEALKTLVATRGESVTLDEFCRQTGISSAPICRLFGGWGAFRHEAGLSRRGKKPSPALFNHQQLCEMLIQAALVYGEEITLEQFLQASGISATPIYHLFGSWPALQQAAGLPVRRRRLSNSQLRALHMTRHVDALMESADPPVTLKELANRSGFTRREVEAEFGSWDELLELLMIETRGGRIERLTDEELEKLMHQAERMCRQLEEYHESPNEPEASATAIDNQSQQRPSLTRPAR